MDSFLLLVSAVVLLVSVYNLFKTSSKQAQAAKLIKSLPGPKAWPIIGTVWDMINIPRNGIFPYIDDCSKQFFPIFRTVAGKVLEIHLLLPQHVEVILNSSSHIDKASFYDYLKPWLGLGLLTSTGKKWHTHRKLLTPTFHFKILENFMEVFVEKSEILVKKLKKEANGKDFDVYPYITHCALDIICETAMGTTVNAQEQSGSDYVSAVYKMSEVTLQRILKPWLRFDFIFQFTKMGKDSKNNLNILHGFTKRVINERKAARRNAPTTPTEENNEDVALLGKKKRMAFLDLLLDVTDENGKHLSDQELREEVDTFMFEGHDTTSAGICWALFLLGTHLEVQERVIEELDEIFQDSDRPATPRDLQNMKYLERVIKESLRLYPSVPFIGRLAKQDIKIGEYTIPAGTELNLHIYHLHRNPDQFPNPEEFNPDNFLPERIQGRHPYAYIPFSAGPRNCIGQKFAMMEEKTVLSYILRNYRIKSLEERKNLVLMSELILRPENGIKLTMESRRKDV